MDSGFVSQVVLPLALFFIMLGVGLSLRVSQFSALWQAPKSVFVGVILQLFMLPILGAFIVTLFQLPPALAVGIMILTFAPGGATSNMITFLARGDTALSVSLTAITGLITPFTMPVLTVLAIGFWLGENAAVAFPVLQTMLKLFVIAVLPAIIGVAINHRWPQFCRKVEKWAKVIACTFLIVIVFGIVKANWDKLPELLLVLGPATLSLVVLAMLLGFVVAKQLNFSEGIRISLAVEVGIQNAATALLITGGVLGNPEMSASALIYGVLMNIPVFLLILYRNRPQFLTYSDRA